MTDAKNQFQSQFQPRNGMRLFALLATAMVTLMPAADAAPLDAEEQAFANLMINASGQRRDRALMKPDARLVSVARARAKDMADRGYFSHVNPEGNGPNQLVKNTGYPLPAHYTTSRSLNTIESITAGSSSAANAWATFLASSPHKRHLLAEDSFYRDQTTFGIGHYYSAGSRYKHYWVVITAPPAGPAGLAITSPAAGARVTQGSIVVSGTSAGTDFLSAIEYRLENEAGAGAWQNASLPSGAGGSWSGALGGFIPGDNTVRVRTFDDDGVQADEKTRTFRWVLVKPLIVGIDGPGTVTQGFAGTTNREVGAALTITAAPGPGAIFDHWEGLPDSPGRDPLAQRQTFLMEEGLSLLAVFVPSPYVAVKGDYQGLIGGDTADAAGTGRLAIRLAGSGVFTGTVQLGGVVVALKGRLNSQGEARVSLRGVGGSPIELTLFMDIGAGAETITGTLVAGGESRAISLARGVAPDVAGTYAAGRLTARISPDAAEPGSPQGHGYATVQITPAGRAVVTGAMADGRPFSRGGIVTRDGNIVLYVPLVGGAGAIAGALQITDSVDADIEGTLRWLNPERPNAARYASPFSSMHTVSGSLYARPAPGEPCVELSPVTNAGELTLDGGDIEAALQQRLLVDGQNRVALTGPANAGLRVALDPLTGRISGSYVHPTAGRRPLRGVVVQKQNGAWGYFLGAEVSGNTELLPAAE